MPELFDNYSHYCKFSAHCLFAKYFDRCDHLSKEDPFQISRTQAAAYGLEKASDFFHVDNITRKTCVCCNELCKQSTVKTVKVDENWLARLTNRLNWVYSKQGYKNLL